MEYHHIQFIAYEVNTVPTVRADNAARPGLMNPEQDFAARCALMQRAIRYAAQASAPATENHVLKVLMIPRLFFGGMTGTLDVSLLEKAIACLQATFATQEWEHWLFVTGMMATPLPGKEESRADACNLTLLQRGGNRGAEAFDIHSLWHRLQDERVCSVTNARGALVAEFVPLSGATRNMHDRSGVVLTLADMSWTLGSTGEVPLLPGTPEIQVQLNLLNGMARRRVPIMAGINALVFDCDGTAGGSSALTSGGEPVSPTGKTAVDDSTIFLDGMPGIAITDLLQRGAGCMAIYPARTIAAAETVNGTVRQLRWQVSHEYQFNFDLVYDRSGQYRTLLCQIVHPGKGHAIVPGAAKEGISGNIASMPARPDHKGNGDVRNKRFALPIKLSLQGQTGQEGDIEMRILSNQKGDWHYALWCQIDLPGFVFDGVAFQFTPSTDDAPPKTCWLE